MIGCAYQREVELVTRLKRVDKFWSLMTCAECGKERLLKERDRDIRYSYNEPRLNSKGRIIGYRKRYCCSWTCYIRSLLKVTENKMVLDAEDVLLLLRYQKEVPWERVSYDAWRSLPEKEQLIRLYKT